MFEILETLKGFLSKNEIAWLLLGFAFLFYLFLALYFHRKDRIELTRQALEKKVDLFFKYSWKGVTLRISKPGGEGVKKESPPIGE